MTANPDPWEKVRSQFDVLPYPHHPLDATPKGNPTYLSLHSFVIPYYLRHQKVIETQGKWILDAGCGSGYKLIALALANPGAHIVGVDISPKSLELAQQRLTYHGIDNVEFHCLPLESLPELGYTFDYINCDDVLYLLDDPVMGLRAMKAVLRSHGIIRANMHSSLQRAHYFRAQEFFTQLGCLQGPPTDDEIALVRQTMGALHEWVMTKKFAWSSNYETNDQMVLMNHLFRGDKGITLAQYFDLLQQADLELLRMVNWRFWNLEDLFRDINELPIAVALGMADMSQEAQLHLFELLHPCHRLLDLYCGHPGQGDDYVPVENWTTEQWQQTTVYLHPQLCTEAVRQDLMACISELRLFELNPHLKTVDDTVTIDSFMAACLLPLLDAPQPMSALVERWLQLRPLDPVTLAPSDATHAFAMMRQLLTTLEGFGYVLLETT